MDIAEWLVLGTLVGFSLYDIREKKIPVMATVLFGVAVMIYRLCTGTAILDLLLGLLPGAGLLLAAFCTKESIGTGDGLVLCMLGLFCGMRETVAILGMALVLSALLAIVLLVFKRVGRKAELPFLPCLCSGYLLCFLW